MKTENNKYKAWYEQIIQRAKNRKLTGYVERHHIIPKALGGSNKKENIVELTGREHLICHLLLPRFLSSSDPMWYALWRMSNSNHYKVNSRLYEHIKIRFSETIGKLTSKAQKGKPRPWISQSNKNRTGIRYKQRKDKGLIRLNSKKPWSPARRNSWLRKKNTTL